MKTVSLSKKDLTAVLEIMAQVTDYKEKVLSARAWSEYQPWINKFIDQARDNRFIVNNRKTNTMLWIIDQIEHSKTSYKNGKPLAETDLGKKVISVCMNAKDGQSSYYNSVSNIVNELFEISED